MALVDTLNSALSALAIPAIIPSSDNIVAMLKAQKGLLMQALLSDSINPQPDYGFEGESVSRTAWRSQIMNQLTWIDQQLANYEPYEIYNIGF